MGGTPPAKTKTTTKVTTRLRAAFTIHIRERRSNRSETAPPTRPKIGHGRNPAAVTMDIDVGSSVIAAASNGIAATLMPSPNAEAVAAPQSRLYACGNLSRDFNYRLSRVVALWTNSCGHHQVQIVRRASRKMREIPVTQVRAELSVTALTTSHPTREVPLSQKRLPEKSIRSLCPTGPRLATPTTSVARATAKPSMAIHPRALVARLVDFVDLF